MERKYLSKPYQVDSSLDNSLQDDGAMYQGAGGNTNLGGSGVGMGYSASTGGSQGTRGGTPGKKNKASPPDGDLWAKGSVRHRATAPDTSDDRVSGGVGRVVPRGS